MTDTTDDSYNMIFIYTNALHIMRIKYNLFLAFERLSYSLYSIRTSQCSSSMQSLVSVIHSESFHHPASAGTGNA